MLYSFEHYVDNRVNIVRWCSVFYVLNPKFSCYGRTDLIHVEADAFYF